MEMLTVKQKEIQKTFFQSPRKREKKGIKRKIKNLK